MEQFARFRISLDYISPEIWRVVDVPVAMSLKGLHDVIQAVIGWDDCHAFEFHVGERRYGIPSQDLGGRVYAAKTTKLAALLAKGIHQFDYVYDFGDDWRATIALVAVDETDPKLPYPRLVAGARRGPPDDIGGPPGYERFVAIMTDPGHPEHQAMSDWYGGPYDPDDMAEPILRWRIAQIGKRRDAGKMAYRRSVASKP